MKYETPYTETEAILAAQEEDTEYLATPIAKMTRRERFRLGAAAMLLHDVCLEAIQQQEDKANA